MSLHSNFIHKIVGNILKKIGKNDLQQSLLLLFANRFTVTEDDYNPTIEDLISRTNFPSSTNFQVYKGAIIQ